MAAWGTKPRSLLMHPAAKPAVFVLCLLPFAYLTWGAATGGLGANPAETLIRGLGDWTLRFLCLVLAVTPLRIRTRTPQLARFRRMLGLFTFFYASWHLFAYFWLETWFSWGEAARDIAERPFILVGFAAWCALLPLALTSFNPVIRRLGARAWKRLHRLVYGIAVLAVLHFTWMRAGKNDFAEVWVYGLILAALLLERVVRVTQGRMRKRTAPVRAKARPPANPLPRRRLAK